MIPLFIWWPGVAAMAPDTLAFHPPMDPSCSTPSSAALPTATLDTILVEEAFLRAFLQLSLTQLTLKYTNLPKFLGLMTPIFALFTNYLLPCWPSKSIWMQLCN